MDPSVGQLELALLRASLHAFERRFYRTIGTLYAELDEARAEALRLRTRFVPSAQREVRMAQEQARTSIQECAISRARAAPDPEKLRHLHHELARSFHPDLASDEPRRVVREKLMSEVNLAWQEQDLRRLELLAGALDHDENGDAARQWAELAKTALCELRDRVEYAARQKGDLLAALSGHIGNQVRDIRETNDQGTAAAGSSGLIARAMTDLAGLACSRYLPFPDAASMGRLTMRAPRDIDASQSVLGEARGLIAAPFDFAVILRLAKDCNDLSPLRKLDPEDLEGFIDEWPDFVNLNDAQIAPLAHFRALECIQLGRTEITGNAFDRFPSLHELRVLILDETGFDDHGLKRLDECVWMQRLDLSQTKVTTAGLRALRNMTALHDLNLYGTAVGEDLSILDRIHALRNLNLGLTRASNRTGDVLGRLHLLETLNLGGTEVTDEILHTLSQLPNLRDLILWETAMSDKGLEQILGMESLRYLDIDQTRVTPQALEAFHKQRPDVRLPTDLWNQNAG